MTTVKAPQVGDRVYLHNGDSGIVTKIYRASAPNRELFYFDFVTDNERLYCAGASEIKRCEPKPQQPTPHQQQQGRAPTGTVTLPMVSRKVAELVHVACDVRARMLDTMSDHQHELVQKRTHEEVRELRYVAALIREAMRESRE